MTRALKIVASTAVAISGDILFAVIMFGETERTAIKPLSNEICQSVRFLMSG